MNRLLQIVPRLPPMVDGIGDFATGLARNLSEWQTTFLSCDPAQPGDGSFVLSERSPLGLQNTLAGISADAILLHYSGYGFHPRGVPFWLVNGLRDHLSCNPRPLLVFFHELWSSSPPWSSPFWLRPFQKRIVRELQQLSAGTMTSTLRMRELLGSDGSSAAVLPIPSCVPPQEPRIVGTRLPLKLIIFGQGHNRERSVAAHAGTLRELARQNAIESLTLAGQGAAPDGADARIASRLIGGGRVAAKGELPADEIANLLNGSDLLLSFYPADLVTKSTTVTAAFASGCSVLLPRPSRAPSYDPAPPFLTCDGSTHEVRLLLDSASNGGLSRNAEAAREWYSKHAGWPVLAGAMQKQLATLQPERDCGEKPHSEIELVAILSSCNRRPLLEKALPSLTNALRNLSMRSAIVVFDAGSTDGSQEVIRAAAASCPIPLELIGPKTGECSFSAGVNAAAAHASSQYPGAKYLLLFETDNLLADSRPVESALRLLKERREVAAAGFTVQKQDGVPAGFGCCFPTMAAFVLGPHLACKLKLDAPRPLWQRSHGCGWSYCDVVYTSPVLIRKQAWGRTNGFDAACFPFSDCDVDWAKRLQRAGFRQAVIQSDAVVHDNRAQLSNWSASRAVHFHRARAEYFRRYQPLWLAAVYPLLFLRHCCELALLAFRIRAPKLYLASLKQRWLLLQRVFSGYQAK